MSIAAREPSVDGSTVGDRSALRRARVANLLLLCISTWLVLIVCEAALRYARYGPGKRGYHLRPPNLARIFRPHSRALPGISGDARYVVNSIGIRGDELTDGHTQRILALGGSTTECVYLDQSEMWTQLLQDSLRRAARSDLVWVGNGGVSGKTTRHHVTALKYLPLETLRINLVIALTGVNDLTSRLARDTGYDPDYMSKPEHGDALVKGTFSQTEDLSGPFYKRTALWRLGRSVQDAFSGTPVQDEAGSVYIGWRQSRQNAREVRHRLPDLSSALSEYARNLSMMIDLAHSKGAHIVLMTQPSMWRADLPSRLQALLWLGWIGDSQLDPANPYYSVAALADGMNRYNETLLRVCKERKVACLDLDRLLDRDDSVFYDDVHFNEAGARMVAAALADYLLPMEH